MSFGTSLWIYQKDWANDQFPSFFTFHDLVIYPIKNDIWRIFTYLFIDSDPAVDEGMDDDLDEHSNSKQSGE